MAKYFGVMQFHDDAITIVMPELPGFTFQTDTLDTREAIAEAENVLADFTGAMLDHGRDIPAPLSFPDGAKLAKELQLGDPDGGKSACIVLSARPKGGKPKRVNISLDSGTLDMIDGAAQARKLSRSAYLAEAARAFG